MARRAGREPLLCPFTGPVRTWEQPPDGSVSAPLPFSDMQFHARVLFRPAVAVESHGEALRLHWAVVDPGLSGGVGDLHWKAARRAGGLFCGVGHLPGFGPGRHAGHPGAVPLCGRAAGALRLPLSAGLDAGDAGHDSGVFGDRMGGAIGWSTSNARSSSFAAFRPIRRFGAGTSSPQDRR